MMDSKPKRLEYVVGMCADSIIEDALNKERISTGFKAMDHGIGDWKKSRLVLLSARPSVGKTSLMLDLALNIAKQQQACIIYSLGISARRLGYTILNKETGIEAYRFRSAENITMDEMKEVSDKVKEFEDTNPPLFIDDNAPRDYYEWIKTAREFIDMHNIRVVFIDYIQLFEFSKADTDTDRHRLILEELRRLAEDLRVTIIALSTVSSPWKKGHHTSVKDTLSPGISMDVLETYVDLAMVLHRNDWCGIENNRDRAVLHVTHNRFGERNIKMELKWDNKNCKFHDIEGAL